MTTVRRRSSARHGGWWPRLAAALSGSLLASGCGGHPPPAEQAPAPVVAAQAEPTGPCDQDHRDHAIAVARAALLRRLGDVRLARPEAEYERIVLTAQTAGHPAPPADAGWMVSFLVAGPADADTASAPALPPLSQPPPPSAPVAANGGAEISIADPRAQAAALARTPGAPAQEQQPTPPGMLQNGALVANPVHPVLAPTEVPGAYRKGEFVRVDGTVLDQ